jgi:flagellar hook-associated protein 2
MAFQVTGLSSDIDTGTLIDATMAVKRARYDRLETRSVEYQTKKLAADQIESTLSALSSELNKLRDRSTMRHMNAQTSDSGALGVTAESGSAIEGSYQILIGQLATAERQVHSGLTPTETWVHTDTVSDAGDDYIIGGVISDSDGDSYQFNFQFGDEDAVSVDLSAYSGVGISLTDLVTEINTAAGYTAASAVLDDDAYRLQLTAETAGNDRSLTITDDDSIAALASTAEFLQKVNADLDTGALVGDGQFVYTYDGVTRTIETGQWTSLGNLVDLINNDLDNPGVSASILEHQGASGGQYHLMLSGLSTGEDHQITVEAETTLTDFLPGEDWTQTQAAQNSRVRVDGYPAGEWIENESNVVASVIPGVTMYLHEADESSSITVSLSRKTTQIVSDLQSVTDAYNSLVDTIGYFTDYDEETGQGGLFQGDSTILNILAQARASLVGVVPGFEEGHDTFWMPSDLGLEIDRDGYLSLDTTVLNSALDEDYEGVLKLLGAARIGATDSTDLTFERAGSVTEGGTYEVQVNYDLVGNIMSAMIRKEGQTEWRDAEVDGDTISGADDTAEEGLVLTIANAQTDQTVTYEVTVQQGFAGRAYESVRTAMGDSGTLGMKRDQYDTEIESLSDRMEREADRLLDENDRLVAKYARFEAALAELNNMTGTYEAMFQSLDAMNNSDD